MTGGRDRIGGLRCPAPNCKTVIHAFTGLQELNKLQAHWRRKHGETLSLDAALELRALAEGASDQPISPGLNRKGGVK
jgi:hypothetical protein